MAKVDEVGAWAHGQMGVGGHGGSASFLAHPKQVSAAWGSTAHSMSGTVALQTPAAVPRLMLNG